MIALDRTLNTQTESVYTLVPLMVQTMTPMHQGTFKETIRTQRTQRYKENFSPIRTVEWYAGDAGGWMEIPVVSGNSLRGRLRRYTAQALFRRLIHYGDPEHAGTQLIHKLLDPNVILTDEEREVLKLFLSGGTLKPKKPSNSSRKKSKQPSTDTLSSLSEGEETTVSGPNDEESEAPQVLWALREPLDRSELERLFPMLPIFGYTNGDTKLRPGALSVTDLIPLCAETHSLLAKWDGLSALIDPTCSIPSWKALLDNHNQRWPVTAVVRSDPMNGRAANLEAEDEVDEEKAKTQMFVINEYLPPGHTLLGGVYVHESLTMVERGLLYTALDALMADGFLGGGRSRGYGHVQWSPQPIANAATAQVAWESHVERNAPAMLDKLVNLYELRKTAAKDSSKGKGKGKGEKKKK